MDNGSVLQAHDLRWWWVLAAGALGCVAVVVTSPLTVLVAAAVLAGFAVPAFHLERCRAIAARCASISVGLCIPSVPGSVLQLVDSL